MQATAAHFQAEGNVVDAINKLLRPKLEKLGAAEVQNVKRDIGIPVGRKGKRIIRSRPGEPPRKETGRLQAGAGYRIVKQDNGLVMLVVYSSRPGQTPNVPQYLERGTSKMAKRPHMARSLARLSQSAIASMSEPT